MKTAALIGAIIPAIFIGLGACSEPIATDVTSANDSMAQLIGADNTLESLLNIKDEAELITRYGKANVKLDTIWGFEGYFTMGTILKTEDASHIEITWMNDSLKKGIVSVTQVSDSDWYADTLESSVWKSSTGVCVGMSIDKLQKINGRVFRFSGFGWDFAGGVISWQGGTLEGKGVAVQLSEGPASASVKVTEEQKASVLGDVEVQSDNPALATYAPRVWSISVAKVQ